jgi:sugar lactone lactonase YvrE
MSSSISYSFATPGVTDVIPIALSPSGNIYVQGNSGTQNIYVYNLSGTFIRTITASDWYFGFCTDYTNNKIYCAGSGTFGTINTTTNTISTFSSAWINDLDIGSDGFIYAVTNSGYKIQKITPSTGAQTNIYTAGTGALQADAFGIFGGITLDANNNIYCVTRGTGYIYKFTTTGTLVGLYATLNSTFGPTFGITCDVTTGSLYVSGAGSPGAVHCVNSGGTISTFFSTTGPSYATFYDKLRNVLVSTSARGFVYVSYPTPGIISSQFTTTGSSTDITPLGVAPNGNVYVSGGSRTIFVFSNSGSFITTIAPPDWQYQFTTDYTNNILYCTGPNAFFSINPTTNTIASQFSNTNLYGCAYSTDGYVYCTRNSGYGIVKIKPSDGTQTDVFAASGGNITADTYGNFALCTFDSNEYLYCITRGIGNIYKFSKDGTLIGLVATTGSAYSNPCGLTCDITTNILYATTTGSSGALFKINGGTSDLYYLLPGPAYSVFYNKITKKVYVPVRPQIVYAMNPYAQPTTPTLSNDKLLFYYRFEADYLNYATGSGVSDASASGVSISSGALLLPGTASQSFKLPSTTFNTFGITVAFWMKCVAIPTNWARIFDFGNGLNANNFYMGFPTTGAMQIKFVSTYLGTASDTFDLGYKLADTNWHHYTLTIDKNGTVAFYVDGVSLLRFNYGVYPYISQLTSNFIGKSPSSSDGYLNAYLNHFLALNRVLSASEILAISSIRSSITVTPATTPPYESFAVSPAKIVYGSYSNFALTYSSPYLISNRQYSLKLGSTVLDTEIYTGAFKSNLISSHIVVDDSGTVWSYRTPPYLSTFALMKFNYDLTYLDPQVNIFFPVNPSDGWMGLKYYNGLIYIVAGDSYNGKKSFFGVVNPYTQTVLKWDNTFYHSDIDIGNDGFGYAVSGTFASNPYSTQWLVDKINLQTYERTTIIQGTQSMFEGANGSAGNGLSSIAFDSDDNMYIGTQGGYLTKWNKSGTRLMAPIQIATAVQGNYEALLFACDKVTNTLYARGTWGTYIYAINTTTFTTSVFANTPLDYAQRRPSIDPKDRRIYFGGYRFDLNPVPTIRFNGALTVTANTLQIFDASSGLSLSTGYTINGDYPCFLQGSKILRLDPETDEEEYIAVERLRKGDLIKTATCGYKVVAFIGKATLKRPADDPDKKNRLYGFRDVNKRHPPLFITGEHCLLYKEKDITSEKRREVRDYMGDDYITEIYHRVPACLDDSGTPYVRQSDSNVPVTIWHFALEHNNLYNNYAVYANGILVETCSIDFLTNRTSMELV